MSFESPSEPFIEIQHEVFASRGDSEKNPIKLYFYKMLTWWLDGCISDMP